MRKKLFYFVVLPFILALLVLVGAAVFAGVHLAQMALDRLRPYGLSGRVITADALLGRLQVQKISFEQEKPKMSLSLKAEEGEIHLPIWRILLGAREVTRLRVKKPQIHLTRLAGAEEKAEMLLDEPTSAPTSAVSPDFVHAKQAKAARDGAKQAEALKKAAKQRALREELRVLLPNIEYFEVEKGTLSLHHRPQVGRRLSLHLPQIDIRLRHSVGKIEIQGGSVQSKTPRQEISLSLHRGEATLSLLHLLDGMIALDTISLQQPTLVVRVLPKKSGQKKKMPKLLPWLRIKKSAIQDGKMTLHFSMKKKKQPHLPPRWVQLDLHSIFATILDFDLRYFLARPFEAEGKATIKGHGAIRYRAKKDAEGKGTKIELEEIPISIVNQLLPRGDMPLRIEKGSLSARLQLKYKDEERTQIQAAFRVYRLVVSVFDGAVKGLKKAAFQLAANSLNKRFEKDPQGYRLATRFSMVNRDLALAPPLLFPKLARSFKRGFLNAFFEKHPVLRPFRKAIERRIDPANAPPPRRGLFQRLKERREERQKERKERGSTRRRW